MTGGRVVVTLYTVRLSICLLQVNQAHTRRGAGGRWFLQAECKHVHGPHVRIVSFGLGLAASKSTQGSNSWLGFAQNLIQSQTCK